MLPEAGLPNPSLGDRFDLGLRTWSRISLSLFYFVTGRTDQYRPAGAVAYNPTHRKRSAKALEVQSSAQSWEIPAERPSRILLSRARSKARTWHGVGRERERGRGHGDRSRSVCQDRALHSGMPVSFLMLVTTNVAVRPGFREADQERQFRGISKCIPAACRNGAERHR